MLAQTYARNLRTTLKVGEVCVSGGLSMVIEDNSKLCEKVDRLKRAFLFVLCVVGCYCWFLLLSFFVVVCVCMCACVYASELILRRSQSPSFFFNNNPGECLQDGGGVEWYWSYPKNLHEIELESWGYLLFGRGRDRSSRGQQ